MAADGGGGGGIAIDMILNAILAVFAGSIILVSVQPAGAEVKPKIVGTEAHPEDNEVERLPFCPPGKELLTVLNFGDFQ